MRIGNFEISKGMLIGGGVVLALLVGFGVIVGVYTSTRNEGREIEYALTREFKGTQARYGQFRLAYADQLSVAREKMAVMSKILKDAVSGRYDKEGAAGTVDRTKLFSAIKEAYPDLQGTDIFDKVLTTVQAGRERFAKDQEMLADMVRSYNTWRSTGAIYHPTVVSWCGFPSDALEVRIGDKVLRGQEALEKMSEVFIGADAVQIFDSGVDKALPSK